MLFCLLFELQDTFGVGYIYLSKNAYNRVYPEVQLGHVLTAEFENDLYFRVTARKIPRFYYLTELRVSCHIIPEKT